MRQQRSIASVVFGVVLASLLAALSGLALAQSPPDAGAVLRQIEQGKREATLPRQAPAEPVSQAASAPAAAGGIAVAVKGFRYLGNTLIAAPALDQLLMPYVGRTLDLAQLREAADAVANAYRAAGWVVSTGIPKQDVTEGLVLIQVTEAVFGQVLLEEGAGERVDSARVLAMIAAAQPAGSPLNADALDRALLLADDLPGITVAGRLQRGREPGQTDLLLKINDEALLTAQLGADNTGARSTGEERVTAGISLNSPLRLGDSASAQLLHTRGTDYLRLEYGLPLGRKGWRAGVNAAAMRYSLVAPDFTGLGVRGSFRSVGLSSSYPLVRSRQRNLYANAQFDAKHYRNEAATARQSDYRTRTLSLGLDGNSFDELGGGGANSASLAWRSGRVALGAPDAGENPALGGRFNALSYSLSRQQVLTRSLTLYGRLTGQEARRTLDSSEKFYLGGVNGVRAYPANEGAGSAGKVASLELRWRAHDAVSLSAFYDAGQVRNFDGARSYSLKGYGVGLAWQAPMNARVQLSLARRDGANPNAGASGRDQDGSLKRNRVWLTASLPF